MPPEGDIGLRATDDALKEIEAVAMRLAREAGRMLMDNFRRPLAVEYKSRFRRDPVTELDRAAEAFLSQEIGQAFPSHGVLGEEGADIAAKDAEYLWVLDPLDGTTNFVGGLPVFAVSIGVLHRLKPAVGAVFVPVGPYLEPGVFHARRGGGAFFETGQVWVGAEEGEPPRRLAGLPAHYDRVFQVGGRLRFRLGDVRNLGSVAFELAMAAAGVLDYTAFGGPRIWDVAAGVLLVQEAGGLVLHRPPRGREWAALEAFQPGAAAMPPGRGELKDWTASIVAGRRSTVEFVAANLRRRRRRWWPLLSWWRRRRLQRSQQERPSPRERDQATAENAEVSDHVGTSPRDS